jgi:hypothetical protein
LFQCLEFYLEVGNQQCPIAKITSFAAQHMFYLRRTSS